MATFNILKQFQLHFQDSIYLDHSQNFFLFSVILIFFLLSIFVNNFLLAFTCHRNCSSIANLVFKFLLLLILKFRYSFPGTLSKH